MSSRIVAPVLVTSLLFAAAAAWAHGAYREVDLVSDLDGRALRTDANVVNPWGLVVTPLGTIRVASNGTATSEIFGPAGRKRGRTFAIPTAADHGPTGVVLNGDRNAFKLHLSEHTAPAIYIFCGQDGSLSGWNPALDVDHAIRTSLDAEGVYTGLALARAGGKPYLYVANFAAGKVEVYDSDFAETNLDGDFKDTALPDGYSPFNVQKIGSDLFVAFAKRAPSGDEQAGAGLGIVSEFDSKGHFIRRVASNGELNAPWGLARAPKNFGRFSGALLVGNFGNGRINAFDFASGSFLGAIEDAHGEEIAIAGLWGIAVGGGSFDRDDADDDAAAKDATAQAMAAGEEPADVVERSADTFHGGHEKGDGRGVARLYFAAGIEEEAHGLFGFIAPVPDEQSGSTPAAGSTVTKPAPIGPLHSPIRLADGRVRFSIDAAFDEPVDLRVYDTAGRLVATPASGVVGLSEVSWDGIGPDGARAPAGIYFYRIQSPTRSTGGRFVILP